MKDIIMKWSVRISEGKSMPDQPDYEEMTGEGRAEYVVHLFQGL